MIFETQSCYPQPIPIAMVLIGSAAVSIAVLHHLSEGTAQIVFQRCSRRPDFVCPTDSLETETGF